MSRRSVRKFNVEVCDELSVEYGFMDKSNINVMYIYIKCWIIPTVEFDYKKSVRYESEYLKDNLLHSVKNGNLFSERIIFDPSYNVDEIGVGGKRFLSYEMFFRKNDGINIQINDFDGIVKELIAEPCKALVEGLKRRGFNVRKEKNA